MGSTLSRTPVNIEPLQGSKQITVSYYPDLQSWLITLDP